MRRSPSRLFRRSVLAIALMALLPVPIVRAAAVQTSVAFYLNPIVYRGQSTAYNGTITTGAPGNVVIETSANGTTGWQTYGTAPISGDPYWQYEYDETVAATVPLGTRYFRAHYPGGAGFLEAFSETKAQEVKIEQGYVTSGGIRPVSGDVILPGTPVEAYGEGSVPASLQRWVDGAWVTLAGPTGGPMSVSLGALGEGDHKFRVIIETTDLWLGDVKEFTKTISKGGTEPTWTGDLTIQAHHALPAQVGVTTTLPGRPLDAAMTVKDVATDTVIATGAVGMTFAVPPLEAGTHQFLVSYAGNDDYGASSKTFTVTATADSLDAGNFGINYSTFYPYKDGYRDTVTVHGDRTEPIAVSIRVYSPAGKVVKGATVPMASGSYSYAWSGRNAAGAILAAGKYKIVQVLTDAGGTTKVVTLYANLSTKKLVTRSTYVTKLGSSVTAGGDAGTGSIVVSKTGGYTKLYSRYPAGWVGVGYQFTLPSATVYKSIAFQVYERGAPSSPGTFIGISNFHTCIYSSTNWNEACFDHFRAIGHSPLTTMWFSTSGSPTDSRYLRTVRGIVSAYSGTHTIYKVRVRVVYQVLV